LKLEPVVGNLVADRQDGTVAFAQYDDDFEGEDDFIFKTASNWVLVARTEADLGPLTRDERWRRLSYDPSVGVWRDDFSNLLKVFQW
jgi:hypothetical protein